MRRSQIAARFSGLGTQEKTTLCTASTIVPRHIHREQLDLTAFQIDKNDHYYAGLDTPDFGRLTALNMIAIVAVRSTRPIAPATQR